MFEKLSLVRSIKEFNYIAWVKLFLIFFFSFIALTNDSKIITSEKPIEILTGSIVFFFIAFFGIPAFFTPSENYHPKWNDNPFLFNFEKTKTNFKRFPLIFFHFGGHWVLAIGLSGLINNLIKFGNLDFLFLRNIIIGTGILIGIYRVKRKSAFLA